MQRRADDFSNPELLQSDAGADNIDDRIHRPHFVEMNILDRNPVNLRLRFAQAAEDRQCPLFDLLAER